MSDFLNKYIRQLQVVQFIAGAVIVIFALLALAGWSTSQMILTSLGSNYIPMAPSTAILFILIGMVMIIMTGAKHAPAIRITALSASIIVAGFSFPMLIMSLLKINPSFETLGFSINQTTGSPLIGHMALPTAFLFTLSGAAVIILMTCRRSFFSNFLPPLLSAIILLTSLVFIIGYAVGKPIMYSPNQIPMALNTAVSFFAIGLVLILEVSLRQYGFRSETPLEERKSLHRFSMFLAIIITGVLFFGYLNVQTLFSTIQGELGKKLSLTARMKSVEAAALLKAGIDPVTMEGFSKWPIAEELTGQIDLIPDTTRINGKLLQPGLDEILFPDGINYVICTEKISQTSWLIISRIPKETAIKPMVRQFIQVTILIAFLLALTVFILILFSRQTRLKYYKEQLVASERLRLAEDQFRNAFEHSSVGKTMIFTDGRFLVNKAFAAMLGYSVAELTDKSWLDLTHPEDQAANVSLMQEMVSGNQQTVRFEKRYLHKDGHEVWVDLQSYLQRDHNGNPLYFITSASDITEYKQMQSDLIRSKEEAERSNRLKDAFIANISHEIRTPLNAILGFTDLLRDEMDEKQNHQYDNYFDIIRNSGHRLTRTVDMILNLSRLQVGEYEPKMSEIRIDSLVYDLMSEYRLAAQKKNIEITFENALGPTIILGDEYCFTHAISNLIDNAIKYTPKGFIRLALYDSEDGKKCLKVEDSGIGVSKDFLEEMFKPFTQEETGSTRKYEGIGLGLSITRKLLATAGASIHVSSTKGAGTTFIVTFQ